MMQPIHVTAHAIQRAKERLELVGTDANIENCLRQRFSRSVYKGIDGVGVRIFDNLEKDIRYILNYEVNTIITVYKLSEVQYSPLIKSTVLLEALRKAVADAQADFVQRVSNVEATAEDLNEIQSAIKEYRKLIGGEVVGT